jgi:hypothetical protein
LTNSADYLDILINLPEISDLSGEDKHSIKTLLTAIQNDIEKQTPADRKSNSSWVKSQLEIG